MNTRPDQRASVLSTLVSWQDQPGWNKFSPQEARTMANQVLEGLLTLIEYLETTEPNLLQITKLFKAKQNLVDFLQMLEPADLTVNHLDQFVAQTKVTEAPHRGDTTPPVQSKMPLASSSASPLSSPSSPMNGTSSSPSMSSQSEQEGSGGHHSFYQKQAENSLANSVHTQFGPSSDMISNNTHFPIEISSVMLSPSPMIHTNTNVNTPVPSITVTPSEQQYGMQYSNVQPQIMMPPHHFIVHGNGVYSPSPTVLYHPFYNTGVTQMDNSSASTVSTVLPPSTAATTVIAAMQPSTPTGGVPSPTGSQGGIPSPTTAPINLSAKASKDKKKHLKFHMHNEQEEKKQKLQKQRTFKRHELLEQYTSQFEGDKGRKRRRKPPSVPTA